MHGEARLKTKPPPGALRQLWQARSLFGARPVSESPTPEDNETQDPAEKDEFRNCDNKPSRPFFQFVAQISEQRERILFQSGEEDPAPPADINTGAYELVKRIWVRRGIWDTGWGMFPGMQWKNERPLNLTEDEPPAQIEASEETVSIPNRRPRLFGD